MTTFQDLHLIPELLKALAKENYQSPTPIQEQAIPSVLKGQDLLGCAQTGTGKTAAFSLPIIQLLSKRGGSSRAKGPIRALILSPTRELALQISDNIQAYSQFTSLSCLAIVGGVSQHGQERALAKGTDILIATPGRLMDLMNQKLVDLRAVEVLVLDEADRMLDMGFIHDVKRIIAKLPEKKQTLFFSATMPPEIAQLANSLLVNPVKVEITPVSSTVDRISQSVYLVDKDNKPALLIDLLQDQKITSALVFTRTKHGADRVSRVLNKHNIAAQAIHGDKSQNSRQNALNQFKNGTIRVLVATDIAARGIDVEELSHVFNFNLPNIPETYVHRIGRTGRAGNSGEAISFCESDELPYLKDIEKLIRKKVPVVQEHPYPMKGVSAAEASKPSSEGAKSSRPASGNRRRNQPAAGKPVSGGKPSSGVKPQAGNKSRPSSNSYKPNGGSKPEMGGSGSPRQNRKPHPDRQNGSSSSSQNQAARNSISVLPSPWANSTSKK
ncbi:DEAD/DEAH box helicase [Paenibacillus sp. GCM10027627]|uniref:DEAD/DEAH box helicase n=1 Tax=unclassified Paenibacillus TaxID=185978 RepID=UPI00362E00A6